MFLRHLRRTRVILHVVDAAAPDPAADYWAVREELRMYNPEYCARPHVVALNKMDLEDAAELQEEVTAEVGRCTCFVPLLSLRSCDLGLVTDPQPGWGSAMWPWAMGVTSAVDPTGFQIW